MGQISPHTVDSVLGREDGLSSGLHISGGMWKTRHITMLIRRIQGKISVGLDFILSGRLGINIMPAARKYLWRITDPLLAEGNIIGNIVRYVHKRRTKGIIHLPIDINILVGGFQHNPIPLLIFMHTHQIHEVLTAADAYGVVILINYL